MYSNLKIKWLAYEKSITTAQRSTCSRVIREAKEDYKRVIYESYNIIGIKDQSNENYIRWRHLASQIKRVERMAIDVLLSNQKSIW